MNFWIQNPCMPLWLGVYQFATFFSCALSDYSCIITLGLPSSPCNSFFIRFIHLIFLLCSSRSHVLHQNSFVSLCIRFLVCPRAFSSYSLVEFSFAILESPVLIVLHDPVSLAFKSLFWFISSSCIVRFVCCFFFSSNISPGFFFNFLSIFIFEQKYKTWMG